MKQIIEIILFLISKIEAIFIKTNSYKFDFTKEKYDNIYND